MNNDKYTKFILTVIAICLTVIVVRDIDIIPVANAAPVDRGDNVLKVQIVSIDESPNLRWEAIPVKVQD
jgi:hypothetical protein